MGNKYNKKEIKVVIWDIVEVYVQIHRDKAYVRRDW